ncbi:MAG: hypothetical protein FWH22_02965, partial [Fibromonadales bacterium]|nr:hypothetical protein [Fibromonadales bacterium]
MAWASVWNGTTNTAWYNTTDTEFTITTAEQLAGLAQLVNEGNGFNGKTINLGANIVLNNTVGWESWGEDTGGLRSWTPIGNFVRSFSGTFDGKGHEVSGIYISITSDISFASSRQGLFGYVGTGGTVKNVGVVDFYIKGDQSVGGVAGLNGGTIANSYSTGTVSGTG